MRCGLGPYQSALYDIVKAALRAERDKAKADKGPGALAAATKGVKGINNTVMELRCICNHPMLRYGPAQRSSSSSACMPGVGTMIHMYIHRRHLLCHVGQQGQLGPGEVCPSQDPDTQWHPVVQSSI